MDKRPRKVRGGLSFFFLVLTFGIIFALINISVGVGASLRIPFTQANFSIGGSLGNKTTVKQALPNYLSSKIADNEAFFNQSHTLTLWLAEGIGILIIGDQPGTPVADLKFSLIK